MPALARVASLALGLLACSSTSSPPPPTAPQVTAAPAPIIELAELTVRFDGHPIARLHADGRTESVGNSAPGPNALFSPGPTLHADGTIELTKGGFKARVEANGHIYVTPPPGSTQVEQLFGTITGTQMTTADGRNSGVRLDGATLVMFAASAPPNVIGVIEPTTLGRTAVLMSVAFLLDLAVTPR